MENKTYIKRDIEENIFGWLESREILVLRGPRQVGKTTILRKIIEELKNKDVNQEKITWISFEDQLSRMDFEEDPLGFIDNITNREKNHYILIDEVQYVKNAGQQLKFVFDTYSFNDLNLKLIVTGSSSLDLNKMGSFLVGRALYFNLYPFSFNEFLRAKDKLEYNFYQKNKIDLIDLYKSKKIQNKNLSLKSKKLLSLLEEYLIYGGYPEVLLEKDKLKKVQIMRNLFSNHLEKDILSLYGLKEKDKIIKLLMHLSNIQGSVIVYEDLCNFSGLKLTQLHEILTILEDTFIIKQIRPFHKNLSTELKKNPKIYFYDIGLRNILISQTKFIDFGSHYEWFVFNLLKEEDLLYWRTKNKTEVDFILRRNLDDFIPIEIKSELKIQKSFRSFLNEYKPEFSIIVNNKIQEQRNLDEIPLAILPIFLLDKKEMW